MMHRTDVAYQDRMRARIRLAKVEVLELVRHHFLRLLKIQLTLTYKGRISLEIRKLKLPRALFILPLRNGSLANRLKPILIFYLGSKMVKRIQPSKLVRPNTTPRLILRQDLEPPTVGILGKVLL